MPIRLVGLCMLTDTDVTHHRHVGYDHTHAWGTWRHEHLNKIPVPCERPECFLCEEHLVHAGPVVASGAQLGDELGLVSKLRSILTRLRG